MRLSAGLVRRARAATGPGAAYEDLTELVELALLNQLELDEGKTDVDGALAEAPARSAVMRQGQSVRIDSVAVLDMPSEPLNSVEPAPGAAPLSPFTNRLFPIKVCCRVLANLSDPNLAEFQRTAAEAARTVGLALREDDADAGRHGLDRRWVALPVGRKGRATINRFINHFSLTLTRSGTPSGPMTILGLGALTDGNRAALTATGIELACAPSPVLDGDVSEGGLLGAKERQIILGAIAANEAERQALSQFAEIVEGNDGIQERVDAAIRSVFGTSSPAEATALRAAMVGRLHDLGLATVKGSGPSAQISVDVEPLIGLSGEEKQR